MNRRETTPYRRKLIDLQNRLAIERKQLTEDARCPMGGAESGGLSNVPIHIADLGSDAYQEELAIRLLDHETQIQEEVVAALDRIAHGTFGICEDCGKKITKQRLESIPYVRRCIVCESRNH